MALSRRSLLFPALFLISAGSLATEIVLTRYFSYLFVQSYVYIIISFTMAGLGAGAVAVFFLQRGLKRVFFPVLWFVPIVILASLFAVGVAQAGLVVSLLFTFVFFAAVGSNMVLVFRESGLPVPYLYASDLVGAAVGAVGSFFLLNVLGATHALLAFGLLATVGFVLVHAGLFGLRKRAGIAFAVLACVSVTAFLVDFENRLLPHAALKKEMTLMLEDQDRHPRIVESSWSAFGRVDLVENDNPLFKTLFIDGAAGTKMLSMPEGRVDEALANALKYSYMGGLPIQGIPEGRRNEALVIGSGGGIDVVTLLLLGYRSVTAVEINPDFIATVKRWGPYNGNLYSDYPSVLLIEGEGRSYVRGSGRQYDLILMSLPIIKSARSYAAQELTENYLFTYQGISEYRKALKEGGHLIVVTHYRNELLRLVTNALKSYLDEGVSIPEAMQSVATIGTDAAPTLILKNGRLDESEVGTFYGILEVFGQRGRTNFVPFLEQRSISVRNRQTNQVEQTPEFHPGLFALSRGRIDLAAFVAAADEDISWVSDDSPFFYQLSKRLPREVLTVTILACVLVPLLGLGFGLRRLRPGVSGDLLPWMYLGAFALLGFAFMLVEIGFLQKYILFWEHQTLALAVTLALILFCTGAGSFVSRGLREVRGMIGVLAAIALVAAAGAAFLGILLPRFQGSPPVLKVLITLAGVGPVFFLMGMPFPYLLRSLSSAASGTALYPWMMGVNSLTTLLAGSVSMVLALQLGYRFVLLTGALGYAVLLVLVVISRRRLAQAGVSDPSAQ